MPVFGRVADAPSLVGQWMLPPASSRVVVQFPSNRASASLVLVVSNVKLRQSAGTSVSSRAWDGTDVLVAASRTVPFEDALILLAFVLAPPFAS